MNIHFVGALLGNSAEYKPLEPIKKSLVCDYEGDALELFIENCLDDFCAENSSRDCKFIWGYTCTDSMEDLMLGFALYYDKSEAKRVSEYEEPKSDSVRFLNAYSGKAWQPYARV